MARIAFICQPFDRLGPASRTSVAIVTANLARQLADTGHSVSILAPDAATTGQDRLLSGINTLAVDTGSLRRPRLVEFLCGLTDSGVPFMAREGYFPVYRSGLIARLTTLSPEIVHVPTFGQYLPYLSRALPGARFILHLHDELWTHLPVDMVGYCLQFASHVVCVNTHIASRLLSRIPHLDGRVSVLHNAADPGLFTPTAAKINQPPRLLYVGRLSPEKGIHVLTAAVKLLNTKFPLLRADLVGSVGLLPYDWLRWIARDDAACRTLLPYYGTGAIGKTWRQLVDRGHRYLQTSLEKAGSARNSISVHGFVPHARLADMYRNSFAIVSPSVCNEIPMSVFEGMAAGLPTVLSNDLSLDGPVVQGRTACVVPRGDPLLLASAIANLIETRGMAASMADAARTQVLVHYSWSNAAARLNDIYRRF